MNIEYIEAITSFIGSLGFPIFISIMLLRYLNETEKKTQDILNDLKNTINILIEKLEKDRSDKT